MGVLDFTILYYKFYTEKHEWVLSSNQDSQLNILRNQEGWVSETERIKKGWIWRSRLIMHKPGEASVSTRITVLDQVLAPRLKGSQVTCQTPWPSATTTFTRYLVLIAGFGRKMNSQLLISTRTGWNGEHG